MERKLIDGNTMTVTGKSLGENVERWVHKHGKLDFQSQKVIVPLEEPIKSTGHIRYAKNTIRYAYTLLYFPDPHH